MPSCWPGPGDPPRTPRSPARTRAADLRPRVRVSVSRCTQPTTRPCCEWSPACRSRSPSPPSSPPLPRRPCLRLRQARQVPAPALLSVMKTQKIVCNLGQSQPPCVWPQPALLGNRPALSQCHYLYQGLHRTDYLPRPESDLTCLTALIKYLLESLVWRPVLVPASRSSPAGPDQNFPN